MHMRHDIEWSRKRPLLKLRGIKLWPGSKHAWTVLLGEKIGG